MTKHSRHRMSVELTSMRRFCNYGHALGTFESIELREHAVILVMSFFSFFSFFFSFSFKAAIAATPPGRAHTEEVAPRVLSNPSVDGIFPVAKTVPENWGRA